jgi:hypothetical protein
MTKKTERILVRQVGPAFLEGNIDDMISQLQDWKNEGWEGIAEEDYIFIELYKNRLETDEEYNLRMFQEQRAKERAEAQRRKQYEELREEFGND